MNNNIQGMHKHTLFVQQHLIVVLTHNTNCIFRTSESWLNTVEGAMEAFHCQR